MRSSREDADSSVRVRSPKNIQIKDGDTFIDGLRLPKSSKHG